MKLFVLIFLMSFAKAETCDKDSAKNLKELQAIVKAQAAQQWTSCDYNGKLVSCEEMHKLNARALPKDQDPNLFIP